MTRSGRSAAVALVVAAAMSAPLFAADEVKPMPGKDTGTPRASQPAAAGPGQSKSSDESPQSTDKATSQGAKSASTGSASRKKKRTSHAAASTTQK